MLHQYRFVVVIALLGLAAALATEKGKLPLALRGLKKTLRRDAGVQPTADARHAGVPVWKRLVALVLCVLAFAVAAAGSTWGGRSAGDVQERRGGAFPRRDGSEGAVRGGRLDALLYRCGNKPYNWGKIAVKIDGTPVVDGLDCFRDQWWWYTPALFLCRDRPGRHVVEVETKAEKNAKSTGFGCHLTGLLVSE